MTTTGRVERAANAPRPGRWVIELGEVDRKVGVVLPSCEEHLSALEQRCGVTYPRRVEPASNAPQTCVWVVQLGGVSRIAKAAIVLPPCDEHLAVFEERCCVRAAGHVEAAGIAPRPRGWVI